MGKNLQQQEPQLTLKNHNPGCMWGLLHHFQYNRWNNVIKMIPRKRLGYSKHSHDHGRGGGALGDSKMHENEDSSVENRAIEAKAIVQSSAHKSSMKSRIKALISEEMHRRKDRHGRSSNYAKKKPLLEQEKALDTEMSGEIKLKEESIDSSPKLGEECSRNNSGSCELCESMLKVNYLKQNEVNKLGKQPVRDHTFLHGNLIYAVEPSQGDSLQESKLFMDALDLLNVREEVFMKILQDPSSSLAHQLHFRRSPNLRFGLTKSISFPASEKWDLNADDPSTKQENQRDELNQNVEEKGENGTTEELLSGVEPSLDNVGSNMLRKRNENKVVLKGFKNIREKLKHVIRDKKKEKNRIIKDAVHHKIPYGGSVSNNEGHVGSDFGKSSKHVFKRASSFNESLDRYKLLEISINRESKDHVLDRLRFKTEENNAQTPIRKSPATLGRILSLPDLRIYSSIQIDDSASNASFVTSEQRPLCMEDSTSKIETCFISESGSNAQENLVDVGEAFDELGYSKTLESSSPFDELGYSKTLESSSPLDLTLEHASQPLMLDEVSEDDCQIKEDEIVKEIEMIVPEDISYSENKVGIDLKEIQMEQMYNDLMLIAPMDTKNETEFNYVRDVLELSGFSRGATLGKWHSSEHPLNPSVFEEVEGCLVDQGESEEVYDHLLLFDLINEVLLGIHERSLCYWPRPITNTSRIHQLPKGNLVLEHVWRDVRWLLDWRPEFDQGIDEAVSRDMNKNNDWMNLQLDAECVVLELEDLIFDDLLDQIILS